MSPRRSPKANCPTRGARSSATAPAEITTELRLENRILYVRIQSSVLRSELFYQREALREEINRRSGVRLVNAVIIR